MITNPSTKYAKLFADAYTELLNAPSPLRQTTLEAGCISSLEEYFTYIGELRARHYAVVRAIHGADGKDTEGDRG